MADLKRMDFEELARMLKINATMALNRVREAASEALSDIEAARRAMGDIPAHVTQLIASSHVSLLQEFIARPSGIPEKEGHRDSIEWHVSCGPTYGDGFRRCEYFPALPPGRYRILTMIIPVDPLEPNDEGNK